MTIGAIRDAHFSRQLCRGLRSSGDRCRTSRVLALFERGCRKRSALALLVDVRRFISRSATTVFPADTVSPPGALLYRGGALHPPRLPRPSRAILVALAREFC